MGRSSSSSSYISSLTTSCSVTRSERPVRRLWISDARLADSTLASRLRSLLLEAAMYALYLDENMFQMMRENDAIPLLVFFVSPFGLDSLCRRNGSLGRHLLICFSSLDGRADDWKKTSLKLCFLK